MNDLSVPRLACSCGGLDPPAPNASNATPPGSGDRRLMELVAERDMSAFGLLHARFSRPMLALALNIVRSRPVAEEVQQDTFQEIWIRACDYRANLGSPFSWIMTITRYKAIDSLRQEIRRSRRTLSLQARCAMAADPPRGGDLVVVAKEISESVREAIALLSSAEREAIELSFYADLTCREAATQLGLPVGTVKARLRRGLAHLKRPLAPLH